MPLKTLKIMSKEKDQLRSNRMSPIPEERSDQVRKQLKRFSEISEIQEKKFKPTKIANSSFKYGN